MSSDWNSRYLLGSASEEYRAAKRLATFTCDALDALERAEAHADLAEMRLALKDVILKEGLSALNTVYQDGVREDWVAPGIYAAIESAAFAFQAALAIEEQSPPCAERRDGRA